jgi:hypothetical protein
MATLYETLLKKSNPASDDDRESPNRPSYGGFRSSGSTKSTGGRFNRRTKTPEKKSSDRPVATPVVREGRIHRVDSGDRELAQRPPVPNANQVQTWRPLTFKEVLTDLGLRLAETMVAAAAHQVWVFFDKRRFIPKHVYR